MYYLITLPIIVVAVIVRYVSDYTGFKTLKIISNIVILLGILFFVYFYLDYNGFNLLEHAKSILKI